MSQVSGGITEAEIALLDQQIQVKRGQIDDALVALHRDMLELRLLIASRTRDQARRENLEALQDSAQADKYVAQMRAWIDAL